MKKSRLTPPYDNKGRTMYSKRGKIGVYMIYKDNVLRYVGYSGNDLYKALYRHFQTWNDKSQQRVVYKQLNDIKVRVIYTRTKQQAANLEKALILKYKPKDNPQQYWLNYEMEPKEKQALDTFINEPARDITNVVDVVPF